MFVFIAAVSRSVAHAPLAARARVHRARVVVTFSQFSLRFRSCPPRHLCPGSTPLLCLQGSSISFITWAPSVNGKCDYDPGAGTPNCGSNKLEEIPSGAIFIDDATVPYGSCTGEPICVYVHDGQLGRGKDGLPETNVPPSCYSSANQLCAICGPFLVTVRCRLGEWMSTACRRASPHPCIHRMACEDPVVLQSYHLIQTCTVYARSGCGLLNEACITHIQTVFPGMRICLRNLHIGAELGRKSLPPGVHGVRCCCLIFFCVSVCCFSAW